MILFIVLKQKLTELHQNLNEPGFQFRGVCFNVNQSHPLSLTTVIKALIEWPRAHF